MILVNCPHCRVSVALSQEGQCPSCRQTIPALKAELVAAPPNWQPLESGVSLPGISPNPYAPPSEPGELIAPVAGQDLGASFIPAKEWREIERLGGLGKIVRIVTLAGILWYLGSFREQFWALFSASYFFVLVGCNFRWLRRWDQLVKKFPELRSRQSDEFLRLPETCADFQAAESRFRFGIASGIFQFLFAICVALAYSLQEHWSRE